MEFTEWWEHPEHKRYRDQVIEGQERIMANLDALRSAVSDLETEQADVKRALDELSTKLAAGGDVSQEDIDAITGRIGTSTSALKDAVEADDPAAPAAPADGTVPAGVPVAEPDAGTAAPTSDPSQRVAPADDSFAGGTAPGQP